MTNAEKYKEVFGMEVDPKNCPTLKCMECPCCKHVGSGQDVCNMDTRAWWLYEEYKEV
ncbi:MAG: hypothetical protein IKE94_03195 [Aeriscardovia sp.]|nr:hypothetical protein [Aeriscardovia sp.]